MSYAYSVSLPSCVKGARVGLFCDGALIGVEACAISAGGDYGASAGTVKSSMAETVYGIGIFC
jgi:hypothetical protein